MEHERLEPGAHKRKNQKQILATLRAAATRAGLVWDVGEQTGSTVQARLLPAEGAEPVGEVEVRFKTDGIEFEGGPTGGERRQALALYTDTRWMLETLEGLAGELAG